jgi:hypothetical protein
VSAAQFNLSNGLQKAALIAIGSAILPGCVPGMVIKSPGAYGRVTDARTHAPIPHAQVGFPGFRTATATDRDGRFDLPYQTKLGIIVLLPWEDWGYALQVAHPGYQTGRVYTKDHHEKHDVALEPKQ